MSEGEACAERVYLPITSISAGSLTVSGSYGSLAPSSSGTHFRIHAPPGIERTGPFFSGFEAGTLSRFTSASSSRNLFGGYRYESPLAGVRDDLWMAVQGRQSGKNFTGLHYTLHRHYDPHLMRFTSTDPAAAPFFNLYSYCGGNPASGYDPDGLFFMSEYVGMWRKIITGKNRDGTEATWADIGESAWAGNPVTGLLPEAVNPFGFCNDIVKSDSVGEWAWKRAKKAPGLGMVLSQGEQFVNTVADSWRVGEEQGVGSGVGNFLLQRTLSNPTPLVGSTARTIYSGYRATQTGDWWDFAEDLASMGDDAFVIATIVVGSKIKSTDPSTGRYSHLKDSPSVGAKKPFSSGQRSRIFRENRKANGGALKSDSTGLSLDNPTMRRRGVKVSPNEAVVDHNIPKSRLGTNSYSNARVISFAENAAKLDSMPAFSGPLLHPLWPISFSISRNAKHKTQRKHQHGK